MQPLDPGEPHVIGAYRLLGRLGAGGMGRVYLGRSAGGRTVAVKVVHPHFALDEEFRARFRREVAAARRVGGEWTAPVLDADPDAPVPWVATGYIAGPPLSRAVTDHGPLRTPSVRVLGAGLARALVAVHALDLVHRDVKPSNVLLTMEGSRLIDFGIARATDGTASLTSTGVSVGSPGYMSPEQILGRGVTGAADVFSLGAVLVYAATGEAPFAGDSSAALLYKVVHEEPELGALDGGIRELVSACLAKDPAARPTPAEVADRLDAVGGAGWLPGPVVEEISRAAVGLLHLESFPVEPSELIEPVEAVDAAPPAASDPAVSGPVAFSSPALGVFGPPVEPDRAAAQWGRPAADPDCGASSGTQGPPQGGGFSVSAAGGRKGRRISCTLALTMAGALAAVTVAGGFLLDLWPGHGADGDEGSNDTAQPPPAATAPSSPGQVDEVPTEFLGTWSGPATERSGLPHGTLTVTFTPGRKGQDVVRSTNSISILDVSVECYGVGRLVSGTSRMLRVEERTDPERKGTAGKCTGGKAVLVFTLADDGTLRYRSQEEAAGTPTATLTKLVR
ncbi:serine/threonine protein kinase [Streptomyces sp. ISL-10]|uniref:serine/threonine-protein kinase n=1 Tax=Streptomyces sp. ISL-10 TaxID=2819172 RepID=UPI001BE75A3B|nr:serine/threonine-protein kinase [Streptomyces sp. ISL-10]MBT2368770.1 serine/threonine protein kinase [Streptomyces sp. ISL-10]